MIYLVYAYERTLFDVFVCYSIRMKQSLVLNTMPHVVSV